MRIHTYSLFLFIAISIFTGCATILTGTEQNVYFNTKPQGADVQLGAFKGVTPCHFILKRGKDHFVTLSLNGYKEKIISINKEIDFIIVTNLLLGGFFPIGLIVDFSNGAAYKLPDNVYVALEPETGQQQDIQPTHVTQQPTVGSDSIVVYKVEGTKLRIACISFKAANEESIKYQITVQEMISTGFITSQRFSVIEREQIEKILKEKQLAQTDIVSAEDAASFGKILNVDYLLMGSISTLGNKIEIDARLVNVDTGESVNAANASCNAPSLLRTAVNIIVNAINSSFSEE
ncbi:MAG: CsgG/HfaB family protein [Planctomycetota bacterium]